jgi:hypothetical protein
MHANTTVAATPPAAKKDEIQADVLPLMDAARVKVREAKMNPVEKRDRCSEILHSPAFEFSIKDDNREERRNLWAEYHAIEERENESDLTDERRAYLLGRAREKLPDYERYAFAHSLVKEIEVENLDLEEPSRTQKALEDRAKDRGEEISDYLSFALSPEQIAFLNSLHGRGGCRRRFRLHRKAAWGEVLITDIGIRAPYGRFDFNHFVERAATLAQIKALLAVWDTKCVAERRDGATVIVGDRIEVVPV